MAYAIALFNGDNFAARGFYTFNGLGPDNAGEFVADRDTACRVASEAADRAINGTLYAVFDVRGCGFAERGVLASSRPWVSFGPPVFVPAACEALNRVHSWREAEAPAPVAAPNAIDPALPLVLSDGTLCELVSIDRESVCVRLRADAACGLRHGSSWNYRLRDGVFCGDTMRQYSRLLNRAAPAPVAAPKPAAPAVRFEVRSGENGTNRDAWGAVAEFDNGKEAGAWVGANKARYIDAGKSLVIVKVELDAVAVDWRAREADRIASGEYLPLPGDWAARIAAVYPDHFVHLASSNKIRVAFTESASSGERDRQKVLTPAEYVQRFFRSDDVPGAYWYGNTRANFITAIHGDGIKPLITPLGDVEAMVRVYRDTERGAAGGCMSYSASHFSTGGVHPVSVYAMGGELAVAFLRGVVDSRLGEVNPDAELLGAGTVLARCLVWIKDGENRQYGRVYGGCSVATRALRTALEAQGFSSGECNGARIAKLECDHGIVMPYLDIGSGTVDDCGDYYVAGGDIDANQTSGLLGEDNRCECEHCGDMSDSDDMRTVYVERRSSENWCYSCVQNEAFYCHETDEYVSDDCGAEVVRSNGSSDTVALWVLERGDIDAVLTDDGWVEGGFECEDCSSCFGPDDANHWDGSDTGDSSHGEGDCICDDCHAARVELVAELEAEAAEAAEAEAQASPELPLASAA